MASLFGNTNNNQGGSSLFGSSTANNSQPKSLFGPSTSQPANNLFGTAQRPQSQQQPSLFGSTANQAQPAGNTNNNPLFASTNNGNQAGIVPGSLAAGLGASSSGALGVQSQREAAASRLQAAGLNASTREKSMTDQMQTLVAKWQPESSETLLQTHLYNSVSAAFAPFYHPGPGESEKDWEDALAKRPESSGDNTWVPVLIRGFKQLGDRVEVQAKIVEAMRVRLHEMNNCLKAIIQKHQQDLTVRIGAAKRQHAALSQRTLRLAVKCQILRNRGYALDATEENLRQKLLGLEKVVFDPSFSSREEEIWARMVTLRERARWLEEEGKRVGAAVEAQRQDVKAQVPDNVVEGTKRVLKDYDGQLQHLAKELDEVKRDLTEWEESQRG